MILNSSFLSKLQNTTASSISISFCTFNPIDKWLEVLEENKKLYERLLESEREKVEILKGKAKL